MLAGVVLNRVGTSRQEALVRRALADDTGVPVLGAIPALGDVFFNQSLLVYGAYLLVPVAWFDFFRFKSPFQDGAIHPNPWRRELFSRGFDFILKSSGNLCIRPASRSQCVYGLEAIPHQ